MKDIAAVGTGGFFGAMARYAVSMWVPAQHGFPYGTLTVNLLGCFFLAWFLQASAASWRISPRLQLAVGTGFTGAFTTFSTFSAETLQLVANHQLVMALIYVLVSVFGGLGFTALGTRIAAIHGKKPRERGEP